MMRMSKKRLQIENSELKKDLNYKINEVSILKKQQQNRDEVIAELTKKIAELNTARDDKEEEMLMLDHVAKTIEEVIGTLIEINETYLMRG